jgi:hypothetical protein
MTVAIASFLSPHVYALKITYVRLLQDEKFDETSFLANKNCNDREIKGVNILDCIPIFCFPWTP